MKLSVKNWKILFKFPLNFHFLFFAPFSDMARRTTLARNQSEHPARGHRDGQINFVCHSNAQGEIDWKKTSKTSTHINHLKFQFLYDFETSLLFHVYRRVASMPNTGVEEEYYRLRHFSITGKGIVNRGDSLKSRRSRSNLSVASSNSRWDRKFERKTSFLCAYSSELLWLSLFRVAFLILFSRVRFLPECLTFFLLISTT